MSSLRERCLALALRLLPLGLVSGLVGALGDLSRPRWLVAWAVARFVRHYRVDLDAAVVPAGGFASFNAFFTRELRPGLRPLDPELTSVLSPADGRLEDLGPIDAVRRFEVKGQSYSVGRLLASESEAERFAGGAFAVVYLSPRDYHRVHSPVSGRVLGVRHIPGSLYPVNAFGVRQFPQLLARNQRVAIEIETAHQGRVVVVMVGATIVGRIRVALRGLETPFPRRRPCDIRFPEIGAPQVERGGALAAFELGSTAVVLLPPVADASWRLRDPGLPAAILVGERIASLARS